MITLRNAEEIEGIRRAGEILAALHRELRNRVAPGMSTAEIDKLGEDFIRSHQGAVPAFKGLYGFPGSLCISINDEVVHGIPSAGRVLAEGDIVSLDAGVQLDGWFADAATTVPVGDVDQESQRLLDVTRASLEAGIQAARSGNRMGDLGWAIQQVAEDAGFGIVRDLVGHGIGRGPHEEPQVPNFGRPGRGLRLQAGMVLAIEPMVNAGGIAVRTLPDRWTVVTADSSRSAHFEHTVAITEEGPLVLTV